MITKFRGSHYYVSWLLNINQLPEIQWMLKNGYDWKQATSKDTSNGLCFPEDGVYDTNPYKVWVAYPPPPWLERIRELVSQLETQKRKDALQRLSDINQELGLD